jgi:hypothetical protein
MTPRACLVLGLLCLALAQALASHVLAPMRAALVPNRDVYGALKPGEFAGTLMLGGFRGLACDLLWMRAQSAKDSGYFYESLALANSISRIQPRFEQIWEYMAWDMAYNIGHEVEDENGQWAWYLAGLEVNVRGIERNPEGERLVRHLAWMFHHKGDDFRARTEATGWGKLLNPVIDLINAGAPPERRIERFPDGPGLGNYEISERLYRATILTAELHHLKVIPYVRRMVAVAIERDGNRLRNQGQHLAALRRYLACLRAWQEVLAWSRQPPRDDDDRQDRLASLEIAQHNEGRLLRKTALLAEDLAEDPAVGARVAAAISARRFGDAERELAAGGWRTALTRAKVRWYDEADGGGDAGR